MDAVYQRTERDSILFYYFRGIRDVWVLEAFAETLGSLAMFKDLWWHLHGEVWDDANAALGITPGIGLGKTRHIETGVSVDTAGGGPAAIEVWQSVWYD